MKEYHQTQIWRKKWNQLVNFRLKNSNFYAFNKTKTLQHQHKLFPTYKVYNVDIELNFISTKRCFKNLELINWHFYVAIVSANGRKTDKNSDMRLQDLSQRVRLGSYIVMYLKLTLSSRRAHFQCNNIICGHFWWSGITKMLRQFGARDGCYYVQTQLRMGCIFI